MSAKSISQPSTFRKPPVVVVPADDKRLSFSTPPDQNFGAFDDDDAKILRGGNLVAIWNRTIIKFEFDGTGIAVVGLTHKSFRPIPTNILPSFSCMVDDQPTDPLDSHSRFPLHSEGASDIPADGKELICRKKGLQADQHHILTVEVTVSSIPAFIDSIRYRPLLPNDDSDKINLNNTILRIDSQDTKYIKFDNQSWEYSHQGRLTSKWDGPRRGGFMDVTILGNQVQELKWFGSVDHIDHDPDWHRYSINLPVVLDGNSSHVQVSYTGQESERLFNLPMNGSISSHVLSIPAPDQYKLSLDHLLVTFGNPMEQNSMDVNSNDTKKPPEKMNVHGVSPAIPIVSGIVGSLSIILVTLFAARWIQRRRRWRHTWKDSALPSAIQHPATSVSSRSSFSRKVVVTGDIEYNPEAQKKLESAFDAGFVGPPQALILHADSGYRLLNASQVPPHYTRM